MQPNRKASWTWYLPIVCAGFLPLWLAFGRTLFDVGGWLIMATLLLMAPVVTVVLILLLLVTLRRPDVKDTQTLQPTEKWLWLALLASGIVYELTLMDGSDGEENINSVLTKFAGHGLDSFSAVLCGISFWAGVTTMVALALYNVYRYIRPPKYPIGTPPADNSGKIIHPTQDIPDDSAAKPAEPDMEITDTTPKPQ